MSNSPRRTAIAAALAAVAVALSAPAGAADSLSFGTGADYASGKYGGTTRTEVLVVPMSARLRWQAWSVRLTLPYVTVRGPADVIVFADDNGGSSGGSGGSSSSGSGRGSDDTSTGGDTGGGSGGGGVDDNGGNSGGGGGSSGQGRGRGGNDSFSDNRSVSGIGDATLSLTRSFNAIADTPVYVDVSGRVKFATGSASKGLGVGATDYTAGSEIGYSGKRGGVYANAARRFLGSTATLQRSDGWQWSAGGWVNLGESVELGLTYSWRETAVVAGIDARAVEANVGVLLGAGWQAGLFAGAGLSDGSPDYSGGLSLSWQLPL